MALLESDRRTVDVEPGKWLQLVVEEKKTQGVCADVGVHFVIDQPDTVEIGVTFSPAYQGRGIATAALRTLLDWLFTSLQTHRVFAQADERNAAVRRLLTRLAFREEAKLVDADWFKGEWSTLCIYGVLKSEYEAAR